MECGAWYKRIPLVDALPAAVKSEGDCAVFAKLRSFNGSRKVARLSFGFQGIQKTSDIKTPTPVTVASAKSSKYNYRSVDTPLEPISPAGKFLSGILTNQRHIFQFAVAEQLEELAADRDGANARHRNSLGSNESFLHGRIAEMKEQECQIAIEEVMYMLIVHKFSEIKVPMVPRLCHCISNGKLEILASKSAELESIHDAEVLEIIREHISTVLGIRGKYDISDNWTATRIRRLLLGRIYAASIMYGYFIKSASLRHRLELNLALDQQDLLFGHQVCHPHAETRTHHQSENLVLLRRPDMGYPLHQMSGGQGRNAGKLRRYVMGFDPSALQRCAKLKSQEAVNLIERHTGALFGDEENGVVDKVEVMAVTNLSLKRLVLEAVAFGSFLWDVERNVDSLYRLKEN